MTDTARERSWSYRSTTALPLLMIRTTKWGDHTWHHFEFSSGEDNEGVHKWGLLSNGKQNFRWWNRNEKLFVISTIPLPFLLKKKGGKKEDISQQQQQQWEFRLSLLGEGVRPLEGVRSKASEAQNIKRNT